MYGRAVCTQRLDHQWVRGDECAGNAGGLAERAHVDDAFGREAEMREAAAAIAQHAEPVRVVDDQPRVVRFGQFAASCGSGARSPSMLNTASVAMSLRGASLRGKAARERVHVAMRVTDAASRATAVRRR